MKSFSGRQDSVKQAASQILSSTLYELRSHCSKRVLQAAEDNRRERESGVSSLQVIRDPIVSFTQLAPSPQRGCQTKYPLPHVHWDPRRMQLQQGASAVGEWDSTRSCSRPCTLFVNGPWDNNSHTTFTIQTLLKGREWSLAQDMFRAKQTKKQNPQTLPPTFPTIQLIASFCRTLPAW